MQTHSITTPLLQSQPPLSGGVTVRLVLDVTYEDLASRSPMTALEIDRLGRELLSAMIERATAGDGLTGRSRLSADSYHWTVERVRSDQHAG